MAAIKILFLVVTAAFAIAITGRTLPIEKTAADVETAFLHPHFPPYRGVFGGFRGGAGAGLGGVGAGFGGRYGNGGVGGMYDNGGGFGSGDAGYGAGTGGIGSLQSGANSGGDDGGDDVEGGFRP